MRIFDLSTYRLSRLKRIVSLSGIGVAGFAVSMLIAMYAEDLLWQIVSIFGLLISILIGSTLERMYKKEVIRRFVANGMDEKKARFLYEWNKYDANGNVYPD